MRNRGRALASDADPESGQHVQDAAQRMPKHAFQQNLGTSGDEYGRQGLSAANAPEHGKLCGARFLEDSERTAIKPADSSIPLGRGVA